MSRKSMSKAALYRPSTETRITSFFSRQYKAVVSDALCVQTFLSGYLHMPTDMGS